MGDAAPRQREYPTAFENRTLTRQTPRSKMAAIGQKLKQFLVDLKDKLVREGRAAIRDEEDTKSKTE